MSGIFFPECSGEVRNIVRDIAKRLVNEGEPRIHNISGNLISLIFQSGRVDYRLSGGSGKQERKLNSCGMTGFGDLLGEARRLAEMFKRGLPQNFHVDSVRKIVVHNVADDDNEANNIIFQGLKPFYIDVEQSHTDFSPTQATQSFESRFDKERLGSIFITIGGQSVNPFFQEFVKRKDINPVDPSEEGKPKLRHTKINDVDVILVAGWSKEDTLKLAKKLANEGIDFFKPPKMMTPKIPETPIKQPETTLPVEKNVYSTIETAKDIISLGDKLQPLLDALVDEEYQNPKSLSDFLKIPLNAAQKILRLFSFEMENPFDPDHPIYILGMPSSTIEKGLVGVAPEIAQGLEKKLLQMSESSLTALAKKHPKLVSELLDKLSLGEVDLLFNRLGTTKAGRIAQVELSRARPEKVAQVLSNPSITKATKEQVKRTLLESFKDSWNKDKFRTLTKLATIGFGSYFAILKPLELFYTSIFAKTEPIFPLTAPFTQMVKSMLSLKINYDSAFKRGDLDSANNYMLELKKQLIKFKDQLDEKETLLKKFDQYEGFKLIYDSNKLAVDEWEKNTQLSTQPINDNEVQIIAYDINTNEILKANVLINGKPQTKSFEGRTFAKKTNDLFSIPLKQDFDIEVFMQGYETFTKVVNDSNFKNKVLRIALTPSKEIIKTGALSIFTNPFGANIFIDGKLQGFQSNHIFQKLEPKDYLVRVEKEGYKPQEERVLVLAGEPTPLSFDLIEEEAKQTHAVITITTQPEINAKVFIDNKEQFGKTPMSVSLKEGKHYINIYDADFESPDQNVLVEAGKSKVVLFQVTAKQKEIIIPNAWEYSIRVLDENGIDDLSFKVILNGKVTGKYTPIKLNLSPSSNYILELSKSGYKTIVQPIQTESLGGVQ